MINLHLIIIEQVISIENVHISTCKFCLLRFLIYFETKKLFRDDVDAKVYVGNLPTEKITDDELLNFFKVYGKVSDIRVYKNHIFVQYLRSDDAKRLIKEGQVSLTFKGNKLGMTMRRKTTTTDIFL